jgi:hypothetical protein
MGRIYSKFKKHAVTSKVKKTGHFEKKHVMSILKES